MYGFTAYYLDMNGDKERSAFISFNGQDMSDKECFMHAMALAYDGIKNGECFDNLEFLYR